jgi:glycosyltransferase involved in cell wall biosynthesis
MKLICIDLERTLPTVPPCTTGQQWVLVRLHGAPLGFVYPPSTGCTPRELGRLVLRQHASAIERHLFADRLGCPVPFEPLDGIPSDCPRHSIAARAAVTVAVCTRNGASRLRECLDALSALDYPEPLLDRLVVDNAPSDESTRDVVAAYPCIRYVREPRPGLDWARNRAAMEARGEIVAYTDDDVSVDPAWVRAIAAAFEEEPHAMCVTGLVLPDELDTDAQILFERYGGFGRGLARRVYRVDVEGGASAVRLYGGTGRFGTGANMAFRKVFFEQAGPFDPALDVGTPTNGGGDLEMFFRVLKHGHALVYEPAAMVRHRHRREYAALREQIANNGIGFYSYLVRTGQAYPEDRAAIARLGVWWFWWWNLRRLLRGILRPSTFPLDLVVAELKGSIVGPRRYALAKRRARALDASI